VAQAKPFFGTTPLSNKGYAPYIKGYALKALVPLKKGVIKTSKN
jgi:hypothetical protein